MANDTALLRRPLLWAGLLLPVTAWVLHLNLSYFMATTACAAADPGLHVLTVILLATAVGGGWMAWMNWRELRADANGTSDRRGLARFLALVGLMAAGIFTLAIATQWLPALILDPCP